MVPDYRALVSVSIASALGLSSAPTICMPMPDHEISPSNADSLKTPTYSSEEGVVAGHSGQFTPGGTLSTVIHTTLAGKASNPYKPCDC